MSLDIFYLLSNDQGQSAIVHKSGLAFNSPVSTSNCANLNGNVMFGAPPPGVIREHVGTLKQLAVPSAGSIQHNESLEHFGSHVLLG